MNKEELINIAKNFKIAGEPINIEKCESGHINKTYAITYKTEKGENKKYILQYVNTNVFPNLPELMKNIKNVTSFMEEKAQEKGETTSRLTIKMIDTIDNNPYAIYNQNWRMEEFIDNTKTYLTTENLSILEEAGKAAGKFQKHLHGFPAEELYEIIPKFHYTPNRVNQLNEALTSKANLEQRKERFELAKDVIKFVTDEKRLNKTNIITNKLENKEIPLRVTHNDTKLNNVLMDANSGEAICVIDLDTIMPSTLLYDFGDAIRFGASTAEEDEKDLSRVTIDLNLYKVFAEGFISEIKNTITPLEIELLPFSAKLMTLECGIRFLTDYLDGDVYFKIHRPDHNLDRARTQFKLVADMENKMDEMTKIIEDIFKEN